MFSAHHLNYSMTLIGGMAPIENDPQFETIFGGFDFTIQPTQAPATPAVSPVTPGSPAPAKQGGAPPVAAPAPQAGLPSLPGPPPTQQPLVPQSQSPADTAYGKTLGVSAIMVGVAAVCLLGAAGVAAFKMLTRTPAQEATPKRKRKVKPVDEDDED